MASSKYSASMDEDLLAEIAEAAEEEGVTLSAWLAQAAEERLGLRGLRKLIDEWQLEHGAFTEEERAQAAYDLAHPLTPEEVLGETEEPSS